MCGLLPGNGRRPREKHLSIQVRQECAMTVDTWTGLTRKGIPVHQSLAGMQTGQPCLDRSFSGCDVRDKPLAKPKIIVHTLALNGFLRWIGVDDEAILPHHPRLPSPECGAGHSGVDGDFRFTLQFTLRLVLQILRLA